MNNVIYIQNKIVKIDKITQNQWLTFITQNQWLTFNRRVLEKMI